MDENIAGELRCPVCLEFLIVPIILPCSHVLCRTPCGERLFQDEFVRCPVCRDNSFVTGGVDSLPRVITIEHIIEQLQDRQLALDAPSSHQGECCGPGDIPCQLCNTEERIKATRSCLVCNVSYCDLCLSISHPDREPFSQHELVEPRKTCNPKPPMCLLHKVPASTFCHKCILLGCSLCTEDLKTHQGHPVDELQEAMVFIKTKSEKDIDDIIHVKEIIDESTQTLSEKLRSFEANADAKRTHINEQCDGLIAEVETKRDFFLSDINYEAKGKSEVFKEKIADWNDKTSRIENVLHYTQDMLKEDDMCSFFQLAKSVEEKLQQINNLKLESASTPVDSGTIILRNKVVDFRKERAILKDLAYLTVPRTPSILIEKCSRSTSSVVLVLDQPGIEYEVTDGYTVYYCTEDNKTVDNWEMMEFKSPGEERKCGRGPPSGNAICLIHDNLDSGTMYYFCVRAYNTSGESEMSDIVNCMTLSVSQSIISVPEIRENQCRAYTYSIQLHSPSPLDVPPDSGISHFLLYRESDVNKIWKSISLYGRVDHRVFALQPDTMYDFVIMACDKNGECQVSNQVTMATERSAY